MVTASLPQRAPAPAHEPDVGASLAARAPLHRTSPALRMLIVVSEAPPIVSGISRTVDRLQRDLRSHGIEADVISANEIPRWQFGEVRLSSFALHWPRVARRLSAYDVVNLHGPAPTMSDVFLAAYAATRLPDRPPLVYTHHSAIDLAGLGPLCRLYDAMTARLASLADRIIVTSESYAAAIEVPGGPLAAVIPWGVDAAQFQVAPRVPRIAGDPLRVLFVGQLRPYKGVPVLLDAVRGEARLSLTIAGGGPLADMVRAHAAELPNVEFVGRVEDDELAPLYARHDVIALPSTTRAEAFGLVLLEGMAAGCVPVASDLPGVRDVAGPTGLVVPVDDADALRTALVGIAENPARLDALSVASRERAATLSWERVATEYARTIRAAVHDGHRRRVIDLLPSVLRPPERAASALARRFDATWWSLMVFPSRDAAQPVAWGRAALEPTRSETPRIAAYVARLRRGVLLGPGGDDAARDLLTRDDIGSAIAIPIPMRDGGLGVLSLSRAAGGGREFTTDDMHRLEGLVA